MHECINIKLSEIYLVSDVCQYDKEAYIERMKTSTDKIIVQVDNTLKAAYFS